MDEVAEALVLSPFREIVLKAKAAAENAQTAAENSNETNIQDGAKELARAAHRLEREGERALLKIEPLCKKQLDTCGQNFVDALKDDDDIAAYRTQLNDLLWEFDDYVELQDFDEAKFAELQALSRGYAPKIVDILIRMKLEPAEPAAPPPLLESDTRPASSRGSLLADHPARSSMTSQSGPDLGLEGAAHQLPNSSHPRRDSVHSNVSADIDEPPPFPEKSPWRMRIKLDEALSNLDPTEEVVRRPNVLTLPLLSDSSPETAHHEIMYSPRSSSTYEQSSQRRNMPSPVSPLQISRRGPGARQSSGTWTGAPQGAHLQQCGNTQHPLVMVGPGSSAAAAQSRDSSYSDYPYSSFSESRTDSGSEMASPVATSYRTSGMSAPDTSAFARIPEEWQGHTERPPPTASARNSGPRPGLERVGSARVHALDSGLIPVEAERSVKAPEPIPRRPADCSIGPNSSLYQLKGFCEGAKEVLKGGVGVKQVRKLNFGSGTVMAAKCRACLFELDWNDVEADINGEESANYVSKSTKIGFRLRFLSKSHLSAHTIEDQVYGCLFCVQQGHTTEESDATVFFSQKQLFMHIARHPRPLPIVAGLNVIEGDAGDVPGKPSSSATADLLLPVWRNGFDLHLTMPPAPSKTGSDHVAGLQQLLETLPAARAVETIRQAIGTVRAPPDTSLPPLQFATGARIVGVQFPARFGGEWASGWNDNAKGLFPASAVRLEQPPSEQVVNTSQQGGANMRAVARWKFAVKEGRDQRRGGSEWLRLEKGETINNIGWAYPGHWCWSGVNSKGKWGIFPQTHIDASTLREGPPADRVSISSHERKMSSLLARMSMRTRAGSSPSDPRMHIH
ncbi:hypothetical protein GGTG_02914 [Gaeumannomyces tritici R3-111a-1]|uniref:SH3 domain-containing protein n=1 Tax=Gaeumannomyces tritici (strain R3-111a-1) TaxID=644352 RepID=J3NNQ7_GAET3|nr:hypothetical protein GGTG_02914 [Gaeumannomyces tritici R3-111a-1]EJT77809.1 hypothetical protein GGTG_02914 [Gaeumannomyces tritici R3-111a-1]